MDRSIHKPLKKPYVRRRSGSFDRWAQNYPVQISVIQGTITGNRFLLSIQRQLARRKVLTTEQLNTAYQAALEEKQHVL